MTYETFLEKLRETPREWYLKDRYIRCNATAIGGSEQCCPITAVDEKHMSAGYYNDAAERLGLDEETTGGIVDAADAIMFDPNIRRDLLIATGLSEAGA